MNSKKQSESRELLNKRIRLDFIRRQFNPYFANLRNNFLNNFSENDDNSMITVRVPSAGGGFTHTKISKKLLKEYYNKIGKEYPTGIAIHTVYDPTVINQAKSEQPERFADPVNNPLNWGIFGVLTGGAGFYNGAVQNTGKAISSTLPGLSFGSTYTSGVGLATRPTLGALTADATLGVATLIPSVNSMINDGVNFTNSTETILGLTPVFGPVFNNVKTGGKALVSTVSKPIKKINLGRELNNSINNTQFINTPVYHTTTYLGNDLRPWSANEWGLHVTPNSNTAQRIAGRIPGSHIKEGIFTFTDNTVPIRISDQGSFQRGFGNFDYNGVEQFDFLQPRQAENMLAETRNPSYVYTNLFEKGGDSFAITNPNSVPFSKNQMLVRFDRPLSTSPFGSVENLYVTNLHLLTPNTYMGFIGNKNVYLSPNNNSFSILKNGKSEDFVFDTYDLYLEGLKKLHNDYIQSVPELNRELYLASNINPEELVTLPRNHKIDQLVRTRTRDIIDNFYNSPEYEERFLKYINDDYSNARYSDFLNRLDDINYDYEVGIFYHPFIRGQYNYNPRRIELSTRTPFYNPNVTIHHEFGHAMYDNPSSTMSKVIKHNDNLIGEASKYLLPDHKLSMNEINYYTNPNELRQRIIPAVEEMFENGWNIEQTYNKSLALLQSLLKNMFNKDYILKLLGGMLTTTPLVMTNNE